MWMEPATCIILRICLTVMRTPFLPTHGPIVRWEIPGTIAHLPKRPRVWSTASVASPQRAAWRWKLFLITVDLKTPMPQTAPLCGVQRQVICFPFFLAWPLCALCLVLALLPLSQPSRKKFLQKGSIALKSKDLKKLYLT